MLVNQIERTYTVYPNTMNVRVYSDTLDTDTGKHIVNIYTYSIELYTNNGVAKHYSNKHTIDLYA